MTSNVEVIAAIALLLEDKYDEDKNVQKRSQWVWPWLGSRKIDGAYFHFFFCSVFVGVFFRLYHFAFLGHLESQLILLKVNHNIMIPNFKSIEAKDKIFQIFWSHFNSSK